MRDRRASRLHVASRVDVDRPPAAVWALLADPGRWPEWSPICTRSRLAAGAALAPGAELTMRLRLFRFLPVTVRVKVTALRPGREIAWEKRVFGVHARHRYRVLRRARGSTVRNDERIAGLGPILRPLVGGWFRRTGLSRASLRGIKRLAEAEGAPA